MSATHLNAFSMGNRFLTTGANPHIAISTKEVKSVNYKSGTSLIRFRTAGEHQSLLRSCAKPIGKDGYGSVSERTGPK